jgi:hypothetical protein
MSIEHGLHHRDAVQRLFPGDRLQTVVLGRVLPDHAGRLQDLGPMPEQVRVGVQEPCDLPRDIYRRRRRASA